MKKTQNKKGKKEKENRRKELVNFLSILKLAEEMMSNPGRTLFVIGAGASCPVVPLAKELKENLVQAFGNELEKILLERKIIKSKIDEATLEQILSAYIEFNKDKEEENVVFKYLKPLIPSVKDNQRPPLGYEILSHFMANDIVHYVISLNFDELFEKSLNNNLGVTAYENVKSRSAFGRLIDFELLEEIKGFRMKALFKPHGTISYPMTLRPTFETTQKLEDEKQKVLKSVLEVIDVIVFVGYSFKDPDIQALFLNTMLQREKKPAVYFVTRSGNVEENPKAKTLVLLAGAEEEKNSMLLHWSPFIKMESDRFFRKLAKAIFNTSDFWENEIKKRMNNSERYFQEYEIKLQKYETIKNMFEKKGKSYPNVYYYRIKDILFGAGIEYNLENRILVELILFMLKTRGKFKEKVLLEIPQIRKYVEEYIKEEEEGIEKLIRKMEFVEREKGEKLPGERIYYCIGKNEDELASSIVQYLKKFHSLELSGNVEKRLKKLMIGLTKDFDYYLIKDLKIASFFKKPEILKNREELYRITKKILTSFKKIKIIAETGEWLVSNLWKEYIENVDKKVELIISDYNKEPMQSFHRHRSESVVKSLCKKIKNLEIKLLPFKENKHHMTLGVDNNICRAIYFYREGKSTLLTPIYLENKDDCEILLKYFNLIWNRAESFQCNKISTKEGKY